MTRLEYYSGRIIAGIVLLLLLLGGLIVWTILMSIPPKIQTPIATTTIQQKPVGTSNEPAPYTPNIKPVITPELSYIMVTSSCDYNFNGECLRVRSAPGTSTPVVATLRDSMVLRADTTPIEKDGITWYKVLFDETLRYPERVTGTWYVASEYTEPFTMTGPQNHTSTTPKTNKRIIVDRSDQSLHAYEGEALFLEIPISTGLELTPTPRGEFIVYMKTPTRYMQGPLPGISDQYYDLPGVPWNLYFTQQGAVIHGAYWHQSFGKPYSHGCVNVDPTLARILYEWADLGTSVLVRD